MIIIQVLPSPFMAFRKLSAAASGLKGDAGLIVGWKWNKKIFTYYGIELVCELSSETCILQHDPLKT